MKWLEREGNWFKILGFMLKCHKGHEPFEDEIFVDHTLSNTQMFLGRS